MSTSSEQSGNDRRPHSRLEHGRTERLLAVLVLRDLEDAGERTTMTELLHAPLHAGPASPDAAIALLRSWRAKTT